MRVRGEGGGKPKHKQCVRGRAGVIIGQVK